MNYMNQGLIHELYEFYESRADGDKGVLHSLWGMHTDTCLHLSQLNYDGSLVPRDRRSSGWKP